MNLGMLGGLLGGDDRRKKFMDMAQGVMKNPEAMKALGGLAGGMGGAEGASEGGASGASGGLGGLLGSLKSPQMGPGGTAGFNPAAADSLPKLGRPIGGADTGLINRPQSMPNTMPQLQRPEMPTPALEPIRDSVNISASNSGPIGGSDTLGSMMDRMANHPAAVENQQTQMLAQRPIGEVRPPDFLGRKGATMEDTPMSHERYNYQTQYMQDGKMKLRPVEGVEGVRGYQAEYGDSRIPRRWQDILANSLHGAAEGFKGGGGWQGALGGAAAGGIGSAVSPIHARDYRFNKEQKPRLMGMQQESQQGEDRVLDIRRKNAEIEGIGARNKATIAGTKDAELERRKTDSLIKLNEAKRQAVVSGQAKMVEIEDENGQIRIVRVNNDGSVDLGGSGRAAMNQDRIESREKISGNQIGSREKIAGQQISSRERIVNTQQRGATGRTGMTQAGANARQDKALKAKAGGEYIPPVGSVPYGPPVSSPSSGSKREQFIQKAIEAGHSRAAAEAEATKRKY